LEAAMALVKEKYYLTHDNSIDLLLKSNNAAVNLAGANKITISVDDTLIESENGASDPILWAKTGYDTGEIRLFLKNENLTVGDYKVPIVVYTVDAPDGIVWDYFILKVLEDPEAS